MLANPKRCQACADARHRFMPTDSSSEPDPMPVVLCHVCRVSGVVCGKCDKPEGECECETERKEQ